jgi:hypothetical protein
MKDYTLRGSSIEDLKLLDNFLKKLPLEIPGRAVAECYVYSEKVPVKEKSSKKQEGKEIRKISSVNFYPTERMDSIDEVKKEALSGSVPFTFKALKAGVLELEYEDVTIGVNLITEEHIIKEKAKERGEKLKYVKSKYEISDEDLDLEELGIE